MTIVYLQRFVHQCERVRGTIMTPPHVPLHSWRSQPLDYGTVMQERRKIELFHRNELGADSELDTREIPSV